MFSCVRYRPHIKVDSARFVPKFELSKWNETFFTATNNNFFHPLRVVRFMRMGGDYVA